MKKKFTFLFKVQNAPKSKWVMLLFLFLFTGSYTNAGINSFSPMTVLADGCPPVSTLPCDQLSVSLPYSLSFSSGVANTLVDKNGLGTGFKMVKAYSGTRLSQDGTPTNTSVPGYEASKLTVTNGRLQMISNKGIASTTSNNQINALGVKVDSRTKLQIETVVINPYYGTSFQQGGIWFGLNDKNYVKLVVTGNTLEMRREINDAAGTSASDQRVTGTISDLNTKTVRLRLIVDPATNTIEGFYSTDGTTYLNVGAAYSTKTLSIANMGLTTSTANTGIYASYRNGDTPVTYTFDEFNIKSLGTTASDSTPAKASNAYMVLDHADKFPANDVLTFSLIQTPWRRTSPDTTAYNRNHNIVKLRIRNRGTGSLVVNQLSLSRPTAWKISQLNGASYSSAAFPLTIAPGSSAEATIEFIAKDQATRVKILRDTLYINSNDDLTPKKKVQLLGLWQAKGEGNSEPYAQEIISAFGFKTRTGFNHDDGSNNGSGIVANSDEILSAFFVRADAAQPVRIVQMGAYHGCCASTERVQWYTKGSTTINTLFTHNKLDGQSLLPRLSGTTATGLAQGSFNTTAAFGLKIGTAYSDRTRNSASKIGMRVWKARDADGNIIPNAYIIGNDYLGTTYTNYDYQDNVYYVSNVRPETGPANYSELAASPSATSFGTVAVGASKTITVPLKNMGQTYASGSDPSITIKRVEVVGQYLSDVSMFTVTAPTTTTLSPQASTNVSVKFAPTSRGIKNAALLVYYNSATPLRVPLYGTADDANFTTKLVKRIKGGSDVSMTIAGQTWESDKAYRQGNIKLDKQIIAGPIAATDADVLYQTYLSSAANLDEIRYAVTLPNGTYQVRLHLVENFWSAAGSRVFRITAENETKLNNFDIFREVGYRTALVKDYVVTVSDGVLSLKFNPTIDRLALAGVEIFQAQAKSATATAISSLEEAAREPEASASQLNMFPNPVRRGEAVQVQLSGFQAQETVTIRLQDLLGREVQQRRVVTDQQGSVQVSWPVEGVYGTGVYLLEAQGSRHRAQGKLVLE